MPIVSLCRFLGGCGQPRLLAYDIKALEECCRHIEENGIKNAIIYILACRVGPFLPKYVKRTHGLGAKIYLNPDGHEWKRTKWPAPVRRYWKESERLYGEVCGSCDL